MAILNYTAREITVKIVYYGPGLSGKTTNIKYIANRIPEEKRGKIITLQTEEDRTLFFDFLPFTVSTANGYKLRLQLYTVPGQVFYESTRKLVLQGADGIVFVADSQREVLDSNLESYEGMKRNLQENGLDYRTIPLVFQYNKRDLPNVLPVDVLNQKLNELAAPYFEAIAIEGKGVLETLYKIVELTMNDLKGKYKLLDTISTQEIIDNIKELVGDMAGIQEEVLELKEEMEELDLFDELEIMPEEGSSKEPEVLEIEMEEEVDTSEMREKEDTKKEVNLEPPPAAKAAGKPSEEEIKPVSLPIEINVEPGQTVELTLLIRVKVKKKTT